MRFVDHEPRDRDVGQQLRERARGKSLRRDVEQPERLAACGIDDAFLRGGIEHRMQRPGSDAAAVQLIDLILHQRDERRDYDRHPRQHDGGKLIAKRLPRSRRHDGEHVCAAEYRIDDAFLAGSELKMSEVCPQR